LSRLFCCFRCYLQQIISIGISRSAEVLNRQQSTQGETAEIPLVLAVFLKSARTESNAVGKPLAGIFVSEKISEGRDLSIKQYQFRTVWPITKPTQAFDGLGGVGLERNYAWLAW